MFIHLIDDEENELYVNVNNIESIEKRKGGFVIRMVSSDYISSNMGYDELITNIRKLTELHNG
jgi:hypothetical protein